MIKGRVSISTERLRQAGWTACLVLMLVLAIGGLRPGIETIRQAIGVRGLLQAGAEISNDNNPFICLRIAGNSAEAQTSLQNIEDAYLRGVGLCMAGELEAGLEELNIAGSHSNADVQYATGRSIDDAQTRVDRIVKLGLGDRELVAVMRNLSNQAGIEPYPALRILAQKANGQPGTWYLWIEGATRLEANSDWQGALNWITEGLEIAPPEVQSSLYLRAGQVHAGLSNTDEYHTALMVYNKALEMVSWIYPDDKITALLARGRIYRNLQEEYGIKLALQDFNSVLKIQPNNYWAAFEIGHIYLYDLMDTQRAESYYRQALEDNPEYPYAYFYLGEVYRTRGENETAANWYRQALERQPDWQAAIDSLKAVEENK